MLAEIGDYDVAVERLVGNQTAELQVLNEQCDPSGFTHQPDHRTSI
jgi:hypothetical protein